MTWRERDTGPIFHKEMIMLAQSTFVGFHLLLRAESWTLPSDDRVSEPGSVIIHLWQRSSSMGTLGLGKEQEQARVRPQSDCFVTA